MNGCFLLVLTSCIFRCRKLPDFFLPFLTSDAVCDQRDKLRSKYVHSTRPCFKFYCLYFFAFWHSSLIQPVSAYGFHSERGDWLTNLDNVCYDFFLVLCNICPLVFLFFLKRYSSMNFLSGHVSSDDLLRNFPSGKWRHTVTSTAASVGNRFARIRSSLWRTHPR